MWSWLKENHPVVYEAIWWGVDIISIISIIISLICIVGKG